MTRPAHEAERVLRLHRLGLNPCQIARMTGIPRGTVRDWIDPRSMPRPCRVKLGCFRCDTEVAVSAEPYVYLLGLYLGDGHLTALPRSVWRLRITQDAKYTGLIQRCAEAVYAVSRRRAGYAQKIGCVDVYAYWKHWLHVFPQHAPGVKSKRIICLELWQKEMIARYPEALMAGLIHSDGCRSINTIKVTLVRGAPREYMYPRYSFSNASDDIRRIFTDTCELLGLRWTRMNARNVAVSRRADVQFLDRFIGPKS